MSFSQSSHSLRFQKPFLHANCQSISGEWKPSDLNLNDVISNIDGKLKFEKNGNFMASSKDITLQGTILHAYCLNLKGQWVESTLNLDERISNIDGVLKLN